MSFREWLLSELVNDGIVDAEMEVEELTKQMLLEDTELGVDDIEIYEDQYREHCKGMGFEPDIDLPEM